MSAELAGVAVLAAAALLAAGLSPIAIALARRTDFYDRPREYRAHARATPFLGGGAVLAAVAITLGLLALLHPTVAGQRLEPTARGGWLVAGAAATWLCGTVDDRIAVAPTWRLALEAGLAVGLWAVGLGWSSSFGTVVDLPLTVLWVCGVTNAFNLMDNMDGACATVAMTSALGTATLALIRGQTGLGLAALALAGGCGGFLPWNLTRPHARVFLGDGGSMPVGFLCGAFAMAVSRHASGGNAGLLVGALLVGLPILDVALVSVSRTRRGVTLVTGGRDHLTHRLALLTGGARRVPVLLAALEAGLGGAAILGYALGNGAVAGIGAAVCLGGLAAIAWLDLPGRRPAGIAYGPGHVAPTSPPDALGAGPAGPAPADAG